MRVSGGRKALWGDELGDFWLGFGWVVCVPVVSPVGDAEEMDLLQ